MTKVLQAAVQRNESSYSQTQMVAMLQDSNDTVLTLDEDSLSYKGPNVAFMLSGDSKAGQRQIEQP